MSSDIFIRAKGLGKSFGLFASGAERAASFLLRRPPREVRHAVAGFDLEARPGDFIGIVGRNGAGKSTLLEMIAGTREPSEGALEVRGRVAALLELGAGFNPHFTGRENAQLCASAYGLTEREIAERMEAIASFAGIEAFMDRPVREYSAGMFARLAFSVIIHVDADILIIDEILGVGDARFQQRSMRFLREFARNKIVLFVSHNETAVASLCNRAFFLWEGRCLAQGAPKAVLHAYHKAIAKLGGGDDGAFAEAGAVEEDASLHSPAPLPIQTATASSAAATTAGKILSVTMTADGQPATTLAGGERIEIAIAFEADTEAAFAGFAVRNPFGEVVFGRDAKGVQPARIGRNECRFTFRMPLLPTGTYALDAALMLAEPAPAVLDRRDVALSFGVASRHHSPGLANLALSEARIVAARREAA